MDNEFEGAVLAFAREAGLFCPGDRVIAAASGGADSMALLQFLLRYRERLGICVEAVHVDHRLRPESGEVAEFVAEFCAARGVTLHRFAADAPVGHRSEEWSRELRYGYFERLAAQNGAKIATGHTLSDQAETLLFRLARGTGLKGACGIPVRRGPFVRPLLGVTKAQAEAYCRRQGIVYVTDGDNLTDAYARNRIRHHALPALESVNPAAQSALGRFCERLAETERYLARQGAHLLERAARPGGYDLTVLAGADPVERQAALRLLAERARPLREGDLPRLEGLAAAGRGAVQLAPGAVLAARRGLLFWQEPLPPESAFEPAPFAPGVYRLPGGYRVELLLLQGKECEESIKFAQTDKKALNNCADYARITGSLCLRTRRPGDVFRPAGRNVGKTLKKLYNELGVPLAQRSALPLLAAGSQVAWLWGQGFAQGLAPTGATRTLLVVRPEKEHSAEGMA